MYFAKFKKIYLGLIALFIVSFSVIANAVPSDSTWTSRFYNRTISSGNKQLVVESTGNGLGEEYLSTTGQKTQSNGKNYVVFSGTVAYSPDRFSGGDKNKPENQCGIQMQFWVADDAPGKASVFVTGSGSTSGGANLSRCPDDILNEAKGKFDRKITNMNSPATFTAVYGSGASEPAKTKDAVIDVIQLTNGDSSQTADESDIPDSDTVTLKGNGVDTSKTTTTRVVGTPPDAGRIRYGVTFENLEPGNYEACSKAVSKCITFVKKSGEVFRGQIQGDESTALKVVSTEEKEEDNSCESKGGALGWITCPTIKIMGNALDWVDGQMTELLRLERSRYDSPELRESSKVFRNFAFSLLIPIMLVMVIATALGFDFVSAYTVKTALPRMVIAVIFIALSFDLLVFVIGFVQVVGDGVQNIILGPFSYFTQGGVEQQMTSTTKLSDLVGSGGQTAATDIGIGGVLVGSAIAGLAGASVTGAIFAILGFVATAFVTMLGVFVLLLFRQTMIVLLLLIAPVAILPWIFPGRDKLYSLWSKTFWLMIWFYPIIMLAVGVGKAMSAVALR